MQLKIVVNVHFSFSECSELTGGDRFVYIDGEEQNKGAVTVMKSFGALKKKDIVIKIGFNKLT